ncbi:MAG: ATP-dependent 6-phosphofructokinase [Spirochaetes bacterium]|nr:ATP-dependent 6-phosphofructokinase [Spirochaetota bacterium]
MAKKNRTKCVGILTSGGDCPGLNAGIRALGKMLLKYNISIVGILDGFTGLIENRYIHMGLNELTGLLTQGGTILGTSRNKPYKMPLEDGTYHDMTGAAIENYHRLGLDCLICLGGGGTQKNAYHLMNKADINIITIPKTIDNDVYGTDVSIGYDTGLTIGAEAIDRLHTTASSHHRIMLVDMMGHNAGWLSLSSGLAAGADIILIPEIEYDIEKVFDELLRRKEHDKRFSIVVVAEGSKMKKEKIDKKNKGNNKKKNKNNSDKVFFPHKVPESELLANRIEKKIGLETRVTSLGYLQRGGIPTPADRMLATHLGTRAGEAVLNGDYGVMTSFTKGKYVLIPLKDIAGRKKIVEMDDPLIKTARCLGICLGD